MIKNYNDFINEDTWQNTEDLNANIDNEYKEWKNITKKIELKKSELINKVKDISYKDISIYLDVKNAQYEQYDIQFKYDIQKSFNEYINYYKQVIEQVCNNNYEKLFIYLPRINNLFFEENYFKPLIIDHTKESTFNMQDFKDKLSSTIRFDIKFALENPDMSNFIVQNSNITNRFHFIYTSNYIPKFLQGTNLSVKILLNTIKTFTYISIIKNPLNHNIINLVKKLSTHNDVYTCIFGEYYVFIDKDTNIVNSNSLLKNSNSKLEDILNKLKSKFDNYVIDPEIIQ
jgi:hypothetical protein